MLKTFANWNTRTLDEYLMIGDTVDEELVDHLVNALPPITYNYLCVQIGGACDYVNGKSTFTTFAKENGEWVYKGECHKGMIRRPYIIVKSIGEYDIVELYSHKDNTSDGFGETYICRFGAEREHPNKEIITGYGIFGKDGLYILDADSLFFSSIEYAEKFIATKTVALV